MYNLNNEQLKPPVKAGDTNSNFSQMGNTQKSAFNRQKDVTDRLHRPSKMVVDG